MKDVLKQTYELYEKKLQDLFNQVADTKKMLNQLAKDLELPTPYPDASPELAVGKVTIKPDQFYNQPLATAVRQYLEMRKEAVEWLEIVTALRGGGYDLPKTKQAEDEARTTILRNTGNFSLIGKNHFGLKSWYPATKKDAPKNDGQSSGDKSGGKRGKPDAIATADKTIEVLKRGNEKLAKVLEKTQ